MNEADLDSGTDALLLASRALVALAARSLADIGEITLPQFRALVVLSRPVPVTVGDIAAALAIHPSTATRLCDRLERKRLVRRRWGARTDRRETTVTSTDKGRRLVARVTERRRHDIAEIAASMTSTELRNAINGLRAFAEAAGELPIVDPFGWADLASRVEDASSE
jgi:DNA-binding MarR family transcriptional regulator